jgi:hypothetical protein
LPNRGGSAIVEFAVIMPLLVLLIFGTIEFCRAGMVLGVVANAARSGAGAGAVTSGDYDSITTSIEAALASGLVVGTPSIEVRVNEVLVGNNTDFKNRAGPGARVCVVVGIGYNQVSWVPWTGWFLKGITLREGACMRREA